MSYQEYLAWADESTHTEWVDGEVIVFMPPTLRHQCIVGFVAVLLSSFANLFKLGEVYTAPTEMRARPDGPAREPDIFFVAHSNRARLSAQRLAGPADLVAEIVSPESATRDLHDKFHEYQAAAIREYLIIDPRAAQQRVYWYALDDAGRYQAISPDEAGRVHSAVLPGFWLQPDWLWQEPLPDPLPTLRRLSPAVRQALRRALDLDTETER
jgi:Uma2 family endonuclease